MYLSRLNSKTHVDVELKTCVSTKLTVSRSIQTQNQVMFTLVCFSKCKQIWLNVENCFSRTEATTVKITGSKTTFTLQPVSVWDRSACNAVLSNSYADTAVFTFYAVGCHFSAEKNPLEPTHTLSKIIFPYGVDIFKEDTHKRKILSSLWRHLVQNYSCMREKRTVCSSCMLTHYNLVEGQKVTGNISFNSN